jgi:hypothetical protein
MSQAIFKPKNLLNSTVIWDMTLCIPLKVKRRFGEHIASILRVEKEKVDDKQTSVGYPASYPRR